MDGVLIDAKDWHYDALNKALGHFGYHISRKPLIYDGLPTDKLNMLSDSKNLPKGLQGFLNELKQVYLLKNYQRCKPTFNRNLRCLD